MKIIKCSHARTILHPPLFQVPTIQTEQRSDKGVSSNVNFTDLNIAKTETGVHFVVASTFCSS